jgi:hypothetical protein
MNSDQYYFTFSDTESNAPLSDSSDAKFRPKTTASASQENRIRAKYNLPPKSRINIDAEIDTFNLKVQSLRSFVLREPRRFILQSNWKSYVPPSAHSTPYALLPSSSAVRQNLIRMGLL